MPYFRLFEARSRRFSVAEITQLVVLDLPRGNGEGAIVLVGSTPLPVAVGVKVFIIIGGSVLEALVGVILFGGYLVAILVVFGVALEE